MFQLLFSISFLLTLFIGSSFGRNDGAPIEACETMMPGHGGEGQVLPLPYTFTSDKNVILGNQTVQLTLEAKADGPAAFKGFLVQARTAGQSRPQGSFRAITVNDAKPLNCADITASSMTHSNNRDKTKVEFVWTPPNIDDDFEIIISVVQDHATYWTQGSKIQVGVTKVGNSGSQFALYAPLFFLTLVKCLY